MTWKKIIIEAKVFLQKTLASMVVYKSKQSYYELFELAGLSWKKARRAILKRMKNWSNRNNKK
jgi:transposase